MRESHTTDNIQDSLIDIIESWNLTDKVIGISHDNAANVTNAI